MNVVAIDGPAGAGKTTVAKAVAEALHWSYVDTGAMYRALALKALDDGVDPIDAAGLAGVVQDTDVSFDGGSVLLDGVDVTARIRSLEVTRAAPLVAAEPEVRKALVQLQREAAERGNVVMEGRDIGTVVVPDAVLKVFLTAELEERARRRLAELGHHADGENLTQMESALGARDSADAGRATSPLIQANDAVPIDTTDKSVDDIVREIVGLLEERIR